MSVLAVSDIVSTNLLSELNLNPVWEKWRGYFFAGSVICSLFPFYMTVNGLPLHCIPIHTAGHARQTSYVAVSNVSSNLPQLSNTDGTLQNGTGVQATLLVIFSTTSLKENEKTADKVELSASETAYVNSQCASQDHLVFMRYSGAIMLGIIVGILIVSSLWLHNEGVKDGIRTFSEASDKFQKQVFSEEEMKRLCVRTVEVKESSDVIPGTTTIHPEQLLLRRDEAADQSTGASIDAGTTSNYDHQSAEKEHINPIKQQLEAHTAVREVLRLLAFHAKKPTIFTWYCIRCKILVIGMLFALVALIILLVTLQRWENNSKCVLKNNENPNSLVEFRCAVDCAQTIFIFLVIFCVTLVLQIVVFVVPYRKWKSAREMRDSVACPGILSIRLMIMFLESARPIRSGLFRKMAEYVHSADFKNSFARNMTRIALDKDCELGCIRYALFDDPPGITDAAYAIYNAVSRRSDLQVTIKLMAAVQGPLNNESKAFLTKLINVMIKHKQVSYELIVMMIRFCDPVTDQGIVSLIDLKSLEDVSLHDDERRSVLCYAFSRKYDSEPDRFAAAKALCKQQQCKELKIKILKKKPRLTIETTSLEEYLKREYPQWYKEILKECTLQAQNSA